MRWCPKNYKISCPFVYMLFSGVYFYTMYFWCVYYIFPICISSYTKSSALGNVGESAAAAVAAAVDVDHCVPQPVNAEAMKRLRGASERLGRQRMDGSAPCLKFRGDCDR